MDQHYYAKSKKENWKDNKSRIIRNLYTKIPYFDGYNINLQEYANILYKINNELTPKYYQVFLNIIKERLYGEACDSALQEGFEDHTKLINLFDYYFNYIVPNRYRKSSEWKRLVEIINERIPIFHGYNIDVHEYANIVNDVAKKIPQDLYEMFLRFIQNNLMCDAYDVVTECGYRNHGELLEILKYHFEEYTEMSGRNCQEKERLEPQSIKLHTAGEIRTLENTVHKIPTSAENHEYKSTTDKKSATNVDHPNSYVKSIEEPILSESKVIIISRDSHEKNDECKGLLENLHYDGENMPYSQYKNSVLFQEKIAQCSREDFFIHVIELLQGKALDIAETFECIDLEDLLNTFEEFFEIKEEVDTWSISEWGRDESDTSDYGGDDEYDDSEDCNSTNFALDREENYEQLSKIRSNHKIENNTHAVNENNFQAKIIDQLMLRQIRSSQSKFLKIN